MMEDWKGNVIKAGDIIVRVQVSPDRIITDRSWIIPQNDGSYIKMPIKLPKQPEFMWNVLGEIPIIEHEGRLYKQYDWGGEKWCFPLEDILRKETSSCIICIKGKSDSEEEYYQYYFSVNY